jgi:hypothetical protein
MASDGWKSDPIRKRVVENMDKVLHAAFDSLKSSEQFAEDLDINRLAVAIEAAMFEQLHTASKFAVVGVY